MKKNFLFIFLIFLVNSIFSYSSIKAVNEKELQKVFNKNKEIIVIYRTMGFLKNILKILFQKKNLIFQMIIV